MIRPMTRDDIAYMAMLIEYTPTDGCRGITNESSSILMDHWTPNSVHVHMFIDRISPQFCREVFRYIFDVCGRGLAIGTTPAHNRPALRFATAMGFEPKYRLRDGWAIGEDIVISELRKENCKFLRKVHVKEHSCPA